MDKSKAFKNYAQEVKLANAEYTRQLDEDWSDVAQLLKFKVKNSDQQEYNEYKKDEVFDDILTRLKTESGIQKIQPIKQNLTDKEKALEKRQKLERL